jgi:hypothetical protein
MGTPLDVTAGVLSIAAFAQQLTTAIVKIKRFVDNVQEAPDELRSIINQVQNIVTVMSCLDLDAQSLDEPTPSHSALTASLKLCEEAVNRVSTLARQLEAELGQGKLRGAIRVVYKKKTLEAMLQKLDRSKADLQLAYTMYEAMRHERRLQRIEQYLGDGRCTRSPTTEDSLMVDASQVQSSAITKDEAETNISSTTEPFCHRQHHFVKASWSLPPWICQYAWEAALHRANGRWTFAFTTYRILSIESFYDIEEDIALGNNDRIKAMLFQRELGLHDQTWFGATLFKVGNTIKLLFPLD